MCNPKTSLTFRRMVRLRRNCIWFNVRKWIEKSLNILLYCFIWYDYIVCFIWSFIGFFPASNFLKVSYDNAKACAVVETTDVSPNLIDVDQKNRQIPTENARNKNIYDSNSKQINLPGLSIDSPYHSEDSAGKFNRLFFFLITGIKI